MAAVLFFVAILIQTVFAGDGNSYDCNKCIRNGGYWCHDPSDNHCSTFQFKEGWCQNEEKLPTLDYRKPGDLLNPIHAEQQLHIGMPSLLKISYASTSKLEASISIVNSTQNGIKLSKGAETCDGGKCHLTVEAIAGNNFCSSSSGVYEYVHVKISFSSLSEVATVKYLIPCACPCSEEPPQVDSKMCNFNGNWSCGICTCRPEWIGEFCEGQEHRQEEDSPKCHNHGIWSHGACICHQGWSGKFCESLNCEDRRGDMGCANPALSSVECSGNGHCGPCDTCICYKDREGSQYFQENNYCSGLCQIVNEYEDCLVDENLGPCDGITKHAYNETIAGDRDGGNRTIWVNCNETVGECRVDYLAMRDESNEISVMVVKNSCNEAAIAAVTGGTKVPIIFGVLGLLAAVAALGGVLLWKHLSAGPPLPLNEPGYTNIDAEGCTGENPLYKSPLSSFKNPTYGKC